MIFLIVGGAIVIALLIIFGIGHALGPPTKPQQLKFDETPADAVALDTSNGIPLALNVPRQLTEEEQKQAADDLNRLRNYIKAEGQR
jgi:hypothetical protein